MLRRSPVTYVIAIAVGVVGAYLCGIFERTNQVEVVSGTALVVAFFGFVILVGAVIQLILLARRNIQPMTEKDLYQWQLVRNGGRSRYVSNAILKGVVLGLLAISWPLIEDYWKGSFFLLKQSAWIYVVLFLACSLAAYFAAVRIWNANERYYNSVSPANHGVHNSTRSQRKWTDPPVGF